MVQKIRMTTFLCMDSHTQNSLNSVITLDVLDMLGSSGQLTFC